MARSRRCARRPGAAPGGGGSVSGRSRSGVWSRGRSPPRARTHASRRPLRARVHADEQAACAGARAATIFAISAMASRCSPRAFPPRPRRAVTSPATRRRGAASSSSVTAMARASSFASVAPSGGRTEARSKPARATAATQRGEAIDRIRGGTMTAGLTMTRAKRILMPEGTVARGQPSGAGGARPLAERREAERDPCRGAAARPSPSSLWSRSPSLRKRTAESRSRRSRVTRMLVYLLRLAVPQDAERAASGTRVGARRQARAVRPP